MNDDKFDCGLLKPIEYIHEPDPRTRHFSKQLTDYHHDVSAFKLSANVPKSVVLQFETAKNLYLHGWFIWEFFTVSKHHALACLELALRNRYESSIPKKYFQKHSKPGLKALLQFAIDNNDLKNEKFKTWQRITFSEARRRYENNKEQEMLENGLEQIELNDDEIKIEEEDKDWDYVQMLTDILPKQRNRHAHGSEEVDMFHSPLRTIQVVSETINQIYSDKIRIS